MKRYSTALIAAITLGAGACSESTTSPQQNSLSLASAFQSVLGGFSQTYNSFGGGDSVGWAPREGRGGPGGGGHHGRGHGGDILGGRELMGGGLGGLFLGHGFGGFGHGRFGDSSLSNCTFNSSSGSLECAVETQRGLTVNRSVAFATANGTVQSAFDSLTTNTINVKVTVSGSVTRRDSALTTVQHSSDRTVSGLASGSTQRTVNGSSAGKETTTGNDSAGAFTVQRTMGDTITNVVIPNTTASGSPAFPTSGTVMRSMSITLNHAGTTSSRSRREVITYNGTSTATLVITEDGTTRTCTLPLPHGRPTCQ